MENHRNGIDLNSFSRDDIGMMLEKMEAIQTFFQQNQQPVFAEFLRKTNLFPDKKSFLVFKNNKYVTIPTDTIAFFYVRHESTIIACLDKQEYIISQSLERIENLVNERHFFRVNRQYLVNFQAVKEVEYYFARKLLVILKVTSPEKLLVSKEKVTTFLSWLEDR